MLQLAAEMAPHLETTVEDIRDAVSTERQRLPEGARLEAVTVLLCNDTPWSLAAVEHALPRGCRWLAPPPANVEPRSAVVVAATGGGGKPGAPGAAGEMLVRYRCADALPLRPDGGAGGLLSLRWRPVGAD